MSIKLTKVVILLETSIETPDGVVTQCHSYPIKPETYCLMVGNLEAGTPQFIEIYGELIT